MFQYAALRALAEKFNATVVLPADSLLRRAFSLVDERTVFMASAAVDMVLYMNGKAAWEFSVRSVIYTNTAT